MWKSHDMAVILEVRKSVETKFQVPIVFRSVSRAADETEIHKRIHRNSSKYKKPTDAGLLGI